MSTKHRKAHDPRLKAALLASAWESLRKNGSQSPIYVPPALQSILPAFEPQAIRAAAGAPAAEPHAHIRRCIAGRQCGGGRKKKTTAQPGTTQGAAPAERQSALAYWATLHPGGHLAAPKYHWLGITTASLDPDTLITDVVSCALFDGITHEEAAGIRRAARPPNWHDSVPTFYESSTPGTWDPYTATFKDGPATFKDGPATSPYQLYEHVEWHWSPEVDGGIINILNIVEDPKGTNVDQTLVQDMLDALDSTGSEGDQTLRAIVQGTKANDFKDMTYFSYDLVRCIQSKFLASWEPGGLDVDDGSYLTAWQPDGKGEGRFFLRASKRIRYSEQADVGGDFSLLLNLLAPAVNTMLMSQLTYDGIREGLDKPAGAPGTASSSSGTGAVLTPNAP